MEEKRGWTAGQDNTGSFSHASQDHVAADSLFHALRQLGDKNDYNTTRRALKHFKMIIGRIKSEPETRKNRTINLSKLKLDTVAGIEDIFIALGFESENGRYLMSASKALETPALEQALTLITGYENILASADTSARPQAETAPQLPIQAQSYAASLVAELVQSPYAHYVAPNSVDPVWPASNSYHAPSPNYDTFFAAPERNQGYGPPPQMHHLETNYSRDPYYRHDYRGEAYPRRREHDYGNQPYPGPRDWRGPDRYSPSPPRRRREDEERRSFRARETNLVPNCELFISGLDFNTTEDALRNYFEQFGKIRRCRILCHPASKKSKGRAFVTFHELGAAQRAHAQQHVIDNRTVVVRYSALGDDERSESIYVGGLPVDTSQPQLLAHFSKCGTVKHIKIQTANGRPFAFVQFGSLAEAESALETLDGVEFMGTPLNLGRPRKKAQWKCRCEYMNFEWRDECVQCGRPNPANSGPGYYPEESGRGPPGPGFSPSRGSYPRSPSPGGVGTPRSQARQYPGAQPPQYYHPPPQQPQHQLQQPNQHRRQSQEPQQVQQPQQQQDQENEPDALLQHPGTIVTLVVRAFRLGGQDKDPPCAYLQIWQGDNQIAQTTSVDGARNPEWEPLHIRATRFNSSLPLRFVCCDQDKDGQLIGAAEAPVPTIIQAESGFSLRLSDTGEAPARGKVAPLLVFVKVNLQADEANSKFVAPKPISAAPVVTAEMDSQPPSPSQPTESKSLVRAGIVSPSPESEVPPIKKKQKGVEASPAPPKRPSTPIAVPSSGELKAAKQPVKPAAPEPKRPSKAEVQESPESTSPIRRVPKKTVSKPPTPTVAKETKKPTPVPCSGVTGGPIMSEGVQFTYMYTRRLYCRVEDREQCLVLEGPEPKVTEYMKFSKLYPPKDKHTISKKRLYPLFIIASSTLPASNGKARSVSDLFLRAAGNKEKDHELVVLVVQPRMAPKYRTLYPDALLLILPEDGRPRAYAKEAVRSFTCSASTIAPASSPPPGGLIQDRPKDPASIFHLPLFWLCDEEVVSVVRMELGAGESDGEGNGEETETKNDRVDPATMRGVFREALFNVQQLPVLKKYAIVGFRRWQSGVSNKKQSGSVGTKFKAKATDLTDLEHLVLVNNRALVREVKYVVRLRAGEDVAFCCRVLATTGHTLKVLTHAYKTRGPPDWEDLAQAIHGGEDESCLLDSGKPLSKDDQRGVSALKSWLKEQATTKNASRTTKAEKEKDKRRKIPLKGVASSATAKKKSSKKKNEDDDEESESSSDEEEEDVIKTKRAAKNNIKAQKSKRRAIDSDEDEDMEKDEEEEEAEAEAAEEEKEESDQEEGSADCHHCGLTKPTRSLARCHKPGCHNSFCVKCLESHYSGGGWAGAGGSTNGSSHSKPWRCPQCLGTCQCPICKRPVKKEKVDVTVTEKLDRERRERNTQRREREAQNDEDDSEEQIVKRRRKREEDEDEREQEGNNRRNNNHRDQRERGNYRNREEDNGYNRDRRHNHEDHAAEAARVQSAAGAPAEEVEGEEEEVEGIMGHRADGAFLVKWVGSGTEDTQWEPVQNLHNCEELLGELLSHPDQSRPSIDQGVKVLFLDSDPTMTRAPGVAAWIRGTLVAVRRVGAGFKVDIKYGDGREEEAVPFPDPDQQILLLNTQPTDSNLTQETIVNRLEDPGARVTPTTRRRVPMASPSPPPPLKSQPMPSPPPSHNNNNYEEHRNLRSPEPPFVEADDDDDDDAYEQDSKFTSRRDLQRQNRHRDYDRDEDDEDVESSRYATGTR